MQKLFINKINKNKKVIQNIEFLNKNYKNKFIHMSYTPLNISELYNLNKQNTPLYSIIDSNQSMDSSQTIHLIFDLKLLINNLQFIPWSSSIFFPFKFILISSQNYHLCSGIYFAPLH